MFASVCKGYFVKGANKFGNNYNAPKQLFFSRRNVKRVQNLIGTRKVFWEFLATIFATLNNPWPKKKHSLRAHIHSTISRSLRIGAERSTLAIVVAATVLFEVSDCRALLLLFVKCNLVCVLIFWISTVWWTCHINESWVFFQLHRVLSVWPL